jgi:hypothetical protein
MTDVEHNKAWAQREEKITSQLDNTIAWYSSRMRRNLYAQRIVSVIVMLCGVFAPVLVAGSNLKILGLENETIQICAFFLTIVLAILEGLKRIFRFEQRWSAYFWARNDLKKMRDMYRIEKIGKEVGSDAWVANFRKLVEEYYAITDKESRDLLDSITAQSAAAKSPE